MYGLKVKKILSIRFNEASKLTANEKLIDLVTKQGFQILEVNTENLFIIFDISNLTPYHGNLTKIATKAGRAKSSLPTSHRRPHTKSAGICYNHRQDTLPAVLPQAQHRFPFPFLHSAKLE